jgi:hypothetical protein
MSCSACPSRSTWRLLVWTLGSSGSVARPGAALLDVVEVLVRRCICVIYAALHKNDRLGVVHKGRSSSAALNAVARQLAVAGFLTDCLLVAAYVPTDANDPADGPSRGLSSSDTLPGDTFRQDFLAAVSAAFGGPSRSSSP